MLWQNLIFWIFCFRSFTFSVQLTRALTSLLRPKFIYENSDYFYSVISIWLKLECDTYEGGYGTLEELLEVITWAQLGIHDKPVKADQSPYFQYADLHAKISRLPSKIVSKYSSVLMIFQVGLLNVDGYYNSLLSFIDKAVEEGFISPSARHIIVSAPNAKELMKKMEVN